MNETHVDEEKTHRSDLDRLIQNFLLDRVPTFVQLRDLREKGWKNPSGDKFFKQQRKRADEADHQTQRHFFNMMRQIGNELDDITGAVSCLNNGEGHPKVLDLCMAPGGFSSTVQQRHPTAEIRGVSLPLLQGGHKLLLDLSNPRLKVWFTDITMLSLEMGVSDIPSDHPDAAHFSQSRPFVSEVFDLVICDGQVLRNHTRESYREQVEACRLTLSQLVLALQRIKHGGSFIMLLHKLDSWDSLELLHTFSKFSQIQLFKPEKKHAIRSSFYLVARGIDPQAPSAIRAVQDWKEGWLSATFRFCRQELPSERVVRSMLALFGETFIELGQPIWSIQAKALRRAKFTKPTTAEEVKES